MRGIPSLHAVKKTHTLDALCVGSMRAVSDVRHHQWTVKCAGRGKHQRTKTDRYGFPVAYYARKKRAFGFQTGDIVRVTPHPKPTQLQEKLEVKTIVSRITIRQSGLFTVKINNAPRTTSWRNCTVLQKSDGYEYILARI